MRFSGLWQCPLKLEVGGAAAPRVTQLSELASATQTSYYQEANGSISLVAVANLPQSATASHMGPNPSANAPKGISDTLTIRCQ
jgi:hypothetical protein